MTQSIPTPDRIFVINVPHSLPTSFDWFWDEEDAAAHDTHDLHSAIWIRTASDLEQALNHDTNAHRGIAIRVQARNILKKIEEQ